MCVVPSFFQGSLLFVRTGLTHGSSGMAACGCSIRLDPSHPRATSKFGGLAEGSPTGCSHGSATKDSAAAAVSSVCGAVCSEDEGWRRKTPDIIRAEASTRVSRLQAAINSMGDGDAEAKKALESSLAKTQKQAEVPHLRQRRNSRVHRKGQEDNSPRRREDPSCKASRGRSEGGEGVRFASVCRPRKESLHRALQFHPRPIGELRSHLCCNR